ncbi:MAG TPA: hypothetical protein VF574_10480 [Allosphingosinicella sp.]|jgi:YD repeat-containing protein
MFRPHQARAAAGVMAVAWAFASPPVAHSQTFNPMPRTSTVDANGVDLVNWSWSHQVGSISLGPPGKGLVSVVIDLPSERDSFSTNMRIEDPTWTNSTRVTATFGSKTWLIMGWGVEGDPSSSFSIDIGQPYQTIYDGDGSIIEFEDPYPYQTSTKNLCAARITRPDGEVLTFYNKAGLFPCRAQSIVSNRGYQIKYEYPSASAFKRSKIIIINNAYEYCNPTADTCSLTMDWPSVTLSTSMPTTYATNDGRTWILSAGGLQSPGETTPGIQWTTQTYLAPNVVGTYDWRVTSVTRDGQTWTYSYPSSDSLLGGGSGSLIRVQDPLGNAARHRRSPGMSGGDPTTGEYSLPNLLVKSANELGNVREYTYNSTNLLESVTLPEGNKHIATYNSQGNLATHTLQAKPGSGLANIITSASYTTSGSYVYCNQPASITDARGNTTTYTYHPTHCGVLTETLPADANGVQAVNRYAYAQRYAWTKNSSGGYSQAATPVWVLSSMKSCRTSATVGSGCAAGASDEITVTYDYGPNSGPNILWVRGQVVTADGVSLRTCYAYDRLGNKISETSPRAGLTSCP